MTKTTDLMKTIGDSLSTLLKSKETIMALIVVAVLAFALGYLSNNANGFQDSDPAIKKGL